MKAIATEVENKEAEITEPLTSYLIFASNKELEQVKAIVDANWDTFTARPFVKKLLKELAIADLSKRKASVRKLVGEQVSREMGSVFAKGAIGTVAGDLALFGRMLADLPENNVDAACQVAHAISTNRIHSMEMDYYTAVDDLKPDDTAGADMIGTVEFNSACFYRYANLDVDQLNKNLQGDGELTRKTAEAFLKAFINAVPTGKQNTFAAHNPPSLVFAVVRTGGPMSLTNAFVKPVAPNDKHSLVERSIVALDDYFGRLAKMHGDGGLKKSSVCHSEAVELKNLKDKKDSVKELIDTVIAAAFPGGAA